MVIVGGKPASILGMEKEVVHMKYFTEPSDFFREAFELQ